MILDSRMRKKLTTIAWLTVAIVALVVLASRIDRETFEHALTDLSIPMVSIALLLYFVSQILLAIRWVVLLGPQNVHISVFQAIKLTFLGLFYNNVMPGSVGGDVLKAWYITHHSKREFRLEAAVTVFVDRLTGLVGMITVGAIASFFLKQKIICYGIDLRWIIWSIVVIMIVSGIVFFSRRMRRVLYLTRVLAKLPFASRLRQIDKAVGIYRDHLPTVGLSLIITAIIQGIAITAIWVLTGALGLERVSLLQCFIIMPIIWLIGVMIPVPGGLGVIEASVMLLFCLVIDPQNTQAAQGAAAALALLIRVMTVACSMPGALVPLFGGHLPKVDQMAKEIEQVTL